MAAAAAVAATAAAEAPGDLLDEAKVAADEVAASTALLPLEDATGAAGGSGGGGARGPLGFFFRLADVDEEDRERALALVFDLKRDVKVSELPTGLPPP